MKRALLALVLLALPALAQERMDQAPCRMDGADCDPVPSYATMPAPSGCVATSVMFFGTPVTVGPQCDTGYTYTATTDTLAVPGTVSARNVTATALATPGSITVTPKLTQTASITTVAGSALADGDYFTIKYGPGLTIPIQFDLSPGDGATGGMIPLLFTAGDSADTIRDNIILALNAAAPTKITASSGGAATVAIVLDTPGATGGEITEDVTNAGFLVTDWTDPTAATTVTYKLVACLADSTCTEAGAASSTAASTATLSASNFLRLTWSAVSGAETYKVYRTVAPTSPATTGIVYSGTALTVDDTGLAGGGETAPTVNGTGMLTAATLTVAGSINGSSTASLSSDFINYTSTPAAVPLTMNVTAGQGYAVSCRMNVDHGMSSGSMTVDMAGGTATSNRCRFFTQVWDGAGTTVRAGGYTTWLQYPVAAAGTLGLPGVVKIDGYFVAATSGTFAPRLYMPNSNNLSNPATPGMFSVGSGVSGAMFSSVGTTATDRTYVSTDSGSSWAAVSGVRGVSAITVSPSNPSIVYAGALLVQGSAVATNRFAISTDGGATWTAQPSGNLGAIPIQIAVHPTNPAIVYAITATSGHVYSSTDSGANWTDNTTGLPASAPKWLAIDPVTPATLYLAIGSAIYKSTDSGANWSATGAVSAGTAFAVAVDPATPTTIYMGGATSGALYKSTDSGASWALASADLAGTGSVRTIAIDPLTTPPTIYAGTASSGYIYKSTNSGANWSAVNSGLSANGATVVSVNQTTGTVYFWQGATTQLYRSTDGAATWSARLGFLPFIVERGSSCTLTKVP